MGNILHVFQYESVTFSFNVTCPGRVKVSFVTCFMSRVAVSRDVLSRVIGSRGVVACVHCSSVMYCRVIGSHEINIYIGFLSFH